jgi:hypothetical protein
MIIASLTKATWICLGGGVWVAYDQMNPLEGDVVAWMVQECRSRTSVCALICNFAFVGRVSR